MIYEPGDLVLIAFPFSGGIRVKKRPALVLVDTGDADIVVARATTRPQQTAADVIIDDWQNAGLLAPTVVRIHKVATIEKRLVHRQLGSLQPADRTAVAEVLSEVFRLS